ncbi:MAG: rRNA maturation RNase YbeY [Pyrinomonadaceae bacterium]
MIEVFNNQRKIQIDSAQFKTFSNNIAYYVEELRSKFFTVTFISDLKMRGLNKQFRGNNATTDVLSFPFEPDEFDLEKNHLGDIVISVEQAERQAKENKLTFESEIKQLILHGVLHLCGYDHETDNGEMNARELELRDKLSI